MPQRKVAVAMSGGVDSSVAAAILKEEYYQVFGITMLLYPDNGDGTIESVKKIADILGIPHYIVDLRRTFKKKVITPFCNEYKRGRTPNPCINCNNYVKFDALLKKSKKLGADSLATGHYARVEYSRDGYHLLKGVDHSKDQSYFLYALGQQQLQHLLMPMGNLYKSQVKRIARELGFNDSIKPESQDICFIPNNDYSSFINECISSPPGDVVDVDSRILGRHSGLMHYTIGQRQGLGLASNKRLYVIKLDTDNNRLVVGNQECLLTNHLYANQLKWISGKAPNESASITAKIRYRSPEAEADLKIKNGTVEVFFTHPQRAAAPGQSIVFYKGEAVLGGGTIESPRLAEVNETDKLPMQTVLH